MEKILRDKLAGGSFGDVDSKHRKIMKAVRAKGNKTTEARFRAALVSMGVSGWKTNYKGLKGTPDFYFPSLRIAVFVDGCFWHGCERCGHVPNKNRPFWSAKIQRNRERDQKTTGCLRREGIAVLRFWEHEVASSPGDCVQRLLRKMRERELKFGPGPGE